jgi:thioredoxin 1
MLNMHKNINRLKGEIMMETESLVKHATDSDFDAMVINSEMPALVDFWAPWCGPCRAIAPVLEDLAKDYSGKVNIVKVNVDENPAVSREYSVRSIPMLVLFNKGQVMESMLGSRPKEQLSAMIERGLSS